DAPPSPRGPRAARPPASGAPPAGAAPQNASPRPPGARPTRRIVLPPRSVGRAATTKYAAAPATPYRSPLACRLAYADESLDALVAWDLLNYYDPESSRRMAAEV